MNAYIETLNEILDGIPRDTIHAEQRRAMQYAIDLYAHPSRGVVDEAMVKRLRWLAARIRINPRIEFTKGDDSVFDEAASALQAATHSPEQPGSGDGHANAVAILDEWAAWIGQRPQIVNQTDMRVAFMAGAAAAHKGQAAALPAAPVAMAIDPQLAAFYQVATVAELLAAQEEHIQKLQDSARRNVKPWEDTFPPTLLPKHLRDSGLTPTRNNMEQVRSEAFNLADTVIEWIESGNVQAARDAIRDSLVAHAAPPAVPDTWQERLRAEYAELDERFTKLCAFLESERFASLHEDDRRILMAQGNGMRAYLNALTFRVDQLDYAATPAHDQPEGSDNER